MKKLFTLALSALALVGLSACGESYSKDVLSADAAGLSFHAVGGWGVWEAKAENKMTATSVAEVAKLDKAVAKKLAKRNLVYLYQFDIEIKDDAGWTTKAMVNGEKKEDIDGSHAIKAIAAEFNAEEQTYTNKYWITNPGDNNNCNAEALTDNIYMPPFQKLEDENGFSWANDPVYIGEKGSFTFVVAQYKEVSAATVYGFGFALIAK